MIRAAEAYAIKAAEDAKRRAGNRRGFALKQFLRGYWQVLTSEHPEIEPSRITFLKAAGLL